MAAKEARRGINEEEIQAQAMGLARAIFVEPTRWQNPLKQIGIEDALGVATITSMQLELELANVPSEQRRGIATTITGGILGGGLKGIFPIGSSVTLQRTEIDGIEFYHRSDIDKESAKARYIAYKELLDAAIEKKRRPAQQRTRTKEESHRKRREEERSARQAEIKSPSTLVFVMLGYYQNPDSDERQGQPEILKEQLNALLQGEEEEGEQTNNGHRSVEFEMLLDPTESFSDNSSRTFNGQDIVSIFERGISQEQLNALLSQARTEVVNAAGKIEETAAHIADDLNLIAQQKLRKPGKTHAMGFVAKRGIAPALMRELLARGNEQIGMAVEIPDHDYPPYPLLLLHLWHERLNIPTIQAHHAKLEELARSGNRVAEMLTIVSKNKEAWSSVVRRLITGGQIDIEGHVISMEDINAVMAPLILSDGLLLRALWQDVLGAMFSAPYGLGGKRRELGFKALRMITDRFATQEIPNLLRPFDRSLRQDQLTSIDQMLGEAKPNSFFSIHDPRQLAIDVLDPVATRINSEVKNRVPVISPKPANYEGGAEASAYKVDLGKSQKNPAFPLPDPQDYVGGEASTAYVNAANLHNAYKFVLSSAWGATNILPGERVKLRQEPASLISQRLLK